MYRFREDDDLGILFVHALGGWTGEVAESFITDLAHYARTMRARHGRFRLLIDSRNEDAPSAEVMGAFEGIEAKLALSGGDRIATIVNTQTRKLRTRHLYESRRICAFVSESSALLWLTNQLQFNDMPAAASLRRR